ncbi:selenoprotein K-like [Gossypium australe]|uniref:Selenoprotein K-like n=1 Tax=Gossypium australe TaxID=47621 RepID=A0A5B6U978_9ROSI|nr:selenoprotein K-like [Gossypium australe]
MAYVEGAYCYLSWRLPLSSFIRKPLSVHVCLGVVKSKRSIWRLRTITDFFWAIINFIGVFFSTMFSMEKSDAYRKGFGSSKKWDGGPGGPGSGPYGGGGGPRRPPRGMDNVRGIDHSTFPSCLWLLLRWLNAASIHLVHIGIELQSHN